MIGAILFTYSLLLLFIILMKGRLPRVEWWRSGHVRIQPLLYTPRVALAIFPCDKDLCIHGVNF